MTTLEIEAAANRGRIASADFDLGFELRQNCIPKFFMDIEAVAGKPYWRRKTFTLSVVANDRDYDLPADFWWLSKLKMFTATEAFPDLKYIGEDDNAIIAARTTTTPTRPTGYYLVAGTVNPWAVYLNAVPDASYMAHGVYYFRINFTDNFSDVDLNQYIPAQFQFGLVHLLRSEIFLDRYGIGDPRYDKENSRYTDWIDKLFTQKEGAARNHARFVT